MKRTRRELVGAGLGLAGLGLLRARVVRTAEPIFTADPFSLGVASGYPEPNAIVLWTRLAPKPFAPGGGMPEGPVEVRWEIAADDGFRNVVRTGQTYATAGLGALGARRGRGPRVGPRLLVSLPLRRTRRARSAARARRRSAARRSAQLDLAVACCQSYEDGHYAAYRAMAADGLDLIVHVGDYIYEQRGASRVRSHDAAETFTLEDYRLRYAIYKSDPHLKAAHAACAWMLASDDHEVDDDYAADLSADRDAPELFLARRAAAYQAYYEHQPLPRRLIPLGAHQRLHTRRSFGDLVDLFMLDSRQYRSPQACGGRHREPVHGALRGATFVARRGARAMARGRSAGEPRALESARPADAARALRPERRRRLWPTGRTAGTATRPRARVSSTSSRSTRSRTRSCSRATSTRSW